MASAWAVCLRAFGTSIYPLGSPPSPQSATISHAAAYLEAAAVAAFTGLAEELTAHAAPSSLARAAHRAAADEVRHAREVGRLARSYGVTAQEPRTERLPIRPLTDIAVENAIEGCVRETFGALIAAWQAEHARNARVRAAMTRIARDEARHAALAWRIFDWTNNRLSDEERARVSRAMAQAISELEHGARAQPDRDVAGVLGLPSATHAVALVHAMRREVWTFRGDERRTQPGLNGSPTTSSRSRGRCGRTSTYRAGRTGSCPSTLDISDGLSCRRFTA